MSEDEERPDAAELEAEEPAEQGGDDFDAFTELDEAFPREPTRRVAGPDGLPMPVLDDVGNEAHAPPFTEENFVCIGDYRAFVIRNDWGEEVARFTPEEVQATPDGRHRVKLETAVERCKDIVRKDRPPVTPRHPPVDRLRAAFEDIRCAVWRPGHHTRSTTPFVSSDWVEVEPVRPPCHHLVQRLDPPGVNQNLKFGWMSRHCSVRRTTTGAFLRLTDEAVRACSVRAPYDVDSAQLIRAFDAEKIEQSRSRTYHDMFALVSAEIFGADGAAPPEDGNG